MAQEARRLGNGIYIITGGLGYIGQSIAADLLKRGEKPLIIDRKSGSGQVSGVPKITEDIRSARVWAELKGHPIEAIIHCAGLIQVGESVKDPAQYFRDNVEAGIVMLNHVMELGRIPLLFSSSAAVYGQPDAVPIVEDAPKLPQNPYGITKRQFEEILESYGQAYGLPYVCLRYFNAVGYYDQVAERHEPETHLLPSVMRLISQGKAPAIFGHDYPTPDGTAIRDFVHIKDLVRAHILALNYLRDGGASMAINAGSGSGSSVLEVVSAFQQCVPSMPAPDLLPRRPGDPPVLVADIRRAREVLDWVPQHSSIESIVREVVQNWKD